MKDQNLEADTKPLQSPFNTPFLLGEKSVQPEPRTYTLEGSRQPIYVATVNTEIGEKLLMWQWTTKAWVEIEELPKLD